MGSFKLRLVIYFMLLALLPLVAATVAFTEVAIDGEVSAADSRLSTAVAVAAADYAKREGFADDGYRVVINCNDNGGQTVFQMHLHLLAGAPLGRFGTPA